MQGEEPALILWSPVMMPCDCGREEGEDEGGRGGEEEEQEEEEQEEVEEAEAEAEEVVMERRRGGQEEEEKEATKREEKRTGEGGGGRLAADAAEAEHAERLAGELDAHVLLPVPLARLHRRVALRGGGGDGGAAVGRARPTGVRVASHAHDAERRRRPLLARDGSGVGALG